jgi:branched-chain amino acid transport system ATP-binding protein
MTLLVIENIKAGYGSGPDILKGLSLNVVEGQVHCIIGPNGAGKSTLLRVISGLLHPREGKLTYKGKDISGLRPDQILKLGISFVPQGQSLFPDMTVQENLRMGGYILKKRKVVEDRISEIVEMFPILQERKSQMAKTLSGGEQQMLAIGRALILDPEIIMLDEPSMGLAPIVAQQIFDTVTLLKDSGMTVIMVEQNARKGLECACEGHVLDLGITRFEGPANTILIDPRIQELYLGKRRSKSQEAEA